MTTTTPPHSKEILPPPIERITVLGWMYRNLFNTWYNALLTFLTLFLIYRAIAGTWEWAVTAARWEVIPNNLRLFMVGLYPSAVVGATDYVWRIWLCVQLIALIGGLSWGIWINKRYWLGPAVLAIPVILAIMPYFSDVRMQLIMIPAISLAGWAIGRWRGARLQRTVIIMWLLYFPVIIFIIRGISDSPDGFLPVVPTQLWGGLLLSLILTVVGIVLSFPLGVLLALGRQSELPIMRNISILYIEIIRGVPLISILFMAQVMLPLFLPSSITIDRVIRAMVGITLFSAAYLAENVRGGLQSIPRGQYEAAHAMGLNGFQTMVFIILPQAIRAVIPILVSQFIALFKDTTLVAIVGLLDLLGIARGVTANPNYIGTQREVFLFLSLIYFVFSYALSYASTQIERNLGVGQR